MVNKVAFAILFVVGIAYYDRVIKLFIELLDETGFYGILILLALIMFFASAFVNTDGNKATITYDEKGADGGFFTVTDTFDAGEDIYGEGTSGVMLLLLGFMLFLGVWFVAEYLNLIPPVITFNLSI